MVVIRPWQPVKWHDRKLLISYSRFIYMLSVKFMHVSSDYYMRVMLWLFYLFCSAVYGGRVSDLLRICDASSWSSLVTSSLFLYYYIIIVEWMSTAELSYEKSIHWRRSRKSRAWCHNYKSFGVGGRTGGGAGWQGWLLLVLQKVRVKISRFSPKHLFIYPGRV